jgi:hypothetical protein
MNENASKQGLPEPGSDHEFLRREQELLAKARETAQRITRRVQQVLEDKNIGQASSLPSEENQPLS